jgi:hypothetical protein
MSSTFKAALANYLKSKHLVAADRAHLERWASDDWINDPIWEKITLDARKRDSGDPEAVPIKIMFFAIQARQTAEAVKGGEDPVRSGMQERRAKLLALADKAQGLADYYGRGHPFEVQEFYEKHMMPLTTMKDLMQREADFLRLRAGEEPEPTTRVSRQKRGQKRAHSREYVAFMYAMVGLMREMCGKPHYAAVAHMTNIAYPDAVVDIDDVRSAVKPTTRRGRRRKGGAHDR